MANEFIQQLSQMIAAARPQMQAPSQGMQNLGPVRESTKVGYGSIGQEFGKGVSEHLDFLYNPDKGRERAIFAAKQLSQMQGPEGSALRQRVLSQPSVQKSLEAHAKLAPELFYRRDDGLWDVADSSFIQQEYEKGGAEVGAIKAGTRRQTAAAVRDESTLSKDIDLLDAQVNDLVQQTLGRKLTNEETQKSMKDKLGLLAAQRRRTEAEVTTEQAKPGLMSAQRGEMESQTREREIMTPYEQRYKEAQINHLNAQAESHLSQVGEDTLKLRMKARNDSIKELLNVREGAEKQIIERYKLVPKPFEEARDHIQSTQAMISGFGPTSIVTGTGEDGEPVMANVPGAIEDAAGRYWVWKSLDKSFDSFVTLWNKGDDPSLKQAIQLRDMAYRMYQSTYGQIKDPKVFQMLDPMPDVAGGGDEVGRVNDAFSKIITMIITIDSLIPPNEKGKLAPNDPVFKIAGELGIQALPAAPGSWYSRGRKQYGPGGK